MGTDNCRILRRNFNDPLSLVKPLLRNLESRQDRSATRDCDFARVKVGDALVSKEAKLLGLRIQTWRFGRGPVLGAGDIRPFLIWHRAQPRKTRLDVMGQTPVSGSPGNVPSSCRLRTKPYIVPFRVGENIIVASVARTFVSRRTFIRPDYRNWILGSSQPMSSGGDSRPTGGWPRTGFAFPKRGLGAKCHGGIRMERRSEGSTPSPRAGRFLLAQ